MFRVDVQIPETSLKDRAEFTVMVETSQRTVATPSQKPVSLFLSSLSIRQSVTFLFRQPSALWKLSVILGDFIPELHGQIDQWFRMDLVSKNSGSDLSDAGVSLRIVLSISRVERDPPDDSSECIRCETNLRRLRAVEMELESVSSQLRVYPQLQKVMETLQVGNISLSFPQSLTQQERDYFKFALMGMNQKAKLTDTLQKEVEDMHGRLKDAAAQHEELRMVAEETSGQLGDQLMHCAEDQHSLSLEKSQAIETVKELKSELTEKSKRENELKKLINRLEQQLAATTNKDFALSHCQTELTQTKETLARTEERNKGLLAELKRLTDESAANQAHSASITQQLLKDKSDLGTKLLSCQQELASKTHQCDSLAADKLAYEGHVTTVAAANRVREELTYTVSVLEKKLTAAEDSKAAAVSRLQIEISDVQRELGRLTNENESLTEEIDDTRLENGRLRDQVATLSSQLEANNREMKTLTRHLAMLEQALCLQEDDHHTREVLVKDQQKAEELIVQLTNDVDGLSDNLIKQSEKTLAGQQVIAKLTEIVERQNAELKVIRKLFHHQSPYNPVDGDSVDQALGQFLNERMMASPIPFRREESGIYSFGSKRVFVKVEQGRVIIRVGGGYMNIEEFIAVYAPMELEKIESRKVDRTTDPLVVKLSQYLEGKDYTACVGLTKRSDQSPRR